VEEHLVIRRNRQGRVDGRYSPRRIHDRTVDLTEK
jgi:hypothetical protein